MIDEARTQGPSEYNPRSIIFQILASNFAAVHSITLASTHAIYELMSMTNPILLENLDDEMRKSLTSVDLTQSINDTYTHTVGPYTWSKTAIDSMPVLEAFIREVLRLNVSPSLSMLRRVIDPNGFTFENGLHIPQKEILGFAQDAIHRDENIYANPDSLDVSRYLSEVSNCQDQRQQAAITRSNTIKLMPGKRLTDTSPHYLVFSHGFHVW
jgi:cytochrome P450